MRAGVLVVMAMTIAIGACRRAENATPASTTGSAPAKQETAATATQGAEGIDLGDTMPPYTAQWLDGSNFDLAARRDKVVLLNVWATWCGPCRYEIPELQAIHNRFGPRGFEVIGVSVDESGAEAVRQFVTEHEMTYPIVLDPNGKLADLLRTSVLPTTVLLDRTGKIVWKKYGAIAANDATLEQAIESAVSLSLKSPES